VFGTIVVPPADKESVYVHRYGVCLWCERDVPHRGHTEQSRDTVCATAAGAITEAPGTQWHSHAVHAVGGHSLVVRKCRRLAGNNRPSLSRPAHLHDLAQRTTKTRTARTKTQKLRTIFAR